MRIMVIGAKSAGKSTFSNKLSKKLSIPVVHIDSIVNKIGRDKNVEVESLIRLEADKSDWILDGNTFTRDRKYRLEKADYVILFKINPAKSFLFHVLRWFKGKMKKDTERFGRSNGLNLGFAFNFAFYRWPMREKQIIADLASMNKKSVVVKNFKEADLLLERIYMNDSGNLVI